MRILLLGDVVGKSGRHAVAEALPGLRRRLRIDFAVVNGENAAHGFGITPRICRGLIEAGADVVTTGNHVWDRREIMDYIDSEPRLLRPLNLSANYPGRGSQIYDAPGGRRVLVVHPMGRLFMEPVDDPFAAVDQAIRAETLGRTVDCILIDLHAEATSEKMAMAHFVDGRASVLVGTHSHVPTADAQILPGGTAYQTDLGMCGDYDSVIGMGKTVAVGRFVGRNGNGRLEPAEGEATVCGLFVETDDRTGLARRVSPVRLGGRLASTEPSADPFPGVR